jgi:hypothetical protein
MAVTLDHPTHRHYNAAHAIPARLLVVAIFILVVICATAAPFRSAAADVGSAGLAATALMGPDSIATIVSTVITAAGVAWLYLKNLAH